jgi:hypothetical protein
VKGEGRLKRIEVAPGLLLDEEMYAVAVEALRLHAADQAVGTAEAEVERVGRARSAQGRGADAA